MNVFLLLAASQAWSGVPYDEATLLEMADVVVEGEVVNAVCRSEIEDRFSRVTVVESTVSVESVVKGDVEESITVQSTMTEYKKEQPSCTDDGSAHGVGQVARFYLQQGDGVFIDFHWSGTVDLPGSDPENLPECAPGDVERSGCATTTSQPYFMGLLVPILVLGRRRLA